MPRHPLLQVSHLSIAYLSASETIHAVRDVSLEMFEGETLALAGETGSGKSTLALAVIGLLDRQTHLLSGDILFDGSSIRMMKESTWRSIRGRKMAIIFQDARGALNPILTVKDHLTETLKAHNAISNKEAKERALELLEEVGIPRGHGKLYPFELSGGMSQRVGIALAICNNPKLLIADEPTSAVDLTIQAQILDLLMRLKQRYGLSLLLISHDLALISQVADKVSAMYHGRIVESGLKEEVLASPAHPYTQGLIQCQPGLQHHYETLPLKAISGAIPIPGQDFEGCAFAPRCIHAEQACPESVPGTVKISETHWISCIRDFSSTGPEQQG